MITLELPIYWTEFRKTKKDRTVLVGMNFYRNAHYFTQNKLKKHFHELVAQQLVGDKIEGRFQLKLSLYYKSPICDGANIAALIEKFTLDALQEHKVIVNDNVKFHKSSSWEVVCQDKANPRCIVSVIPYE
jgi:hypothetical protein